jgi:branched-chain amino acid transport system ATP-binding protein
MLEVDRLSVQYGAVRALRGISLRVAEGEIVAVIGPNGAGKSTLLWTIAGVVAPSGGSVRFLDAEITGRPPEAIARDGIALVPEGRHIFRTLTVRENLLMGVGVRRRRGSSRDDGFEEVFARFPVLERRLSSPAGQLSGGEAQQLAIARALLMRPRLLLLDEPSFGLAPLIVGEVFATLDRLRDEGSTILLIEQNAAQAVRLADRTYVLRTGEIEREAAGDQLLNETDFVSAYFGGEESRSAPARL